MGGSKAHENLRLLALEADDDAASAELQALKSRVEHLLKLEELVVHPSADGLEGELGRVLAARVQAALELSDDL
eukprot:3089332-Heterocapsa_arctica.AAC.1